MYFILEELQQHKKIPAFFHSSILSSREDFRNLQSPVCLGGYFSLIIIISQKETHYRKKVASSTMLE